MLHNKTVNWALVSIKSCDFKANSGGYPLEIMSKGSRVRITGGFSHFRVSSKTRMQKILVY